MSSVSFLLIAAVAQAFLMATVMSFMPYSRAINDVGLTVMNSLQSRDNLFLSPVSIYIALAMVHLGARGKTKDQLEAALKLGSRGLPTPDLHMNSKYLEYLRSPNDYNVTTANGIFVQNDFPLRRSFVRNIQTFYNAVAKEVDFAGNSEGAKEEINAWVSQQTHGLISNLLEENPDRNTKIAMFNAIHFRSFWKTKFDPKNTVIGRFYNFNGVFSVAKLMQMIDVSFLYYEDPLSGYKFLEMPYEGHDISMLLALPIDDKIFPNLKMSNSVLYRINRNLLKTKLSMVVVPKFHIEHDIPMKQILKSMGVEDLFTANADLRGVSDLSYNNMAVTTAIHKAVIEVDEEGSTAATATGFIGELNRPSAISYPDFIANRPFQFYIIDRKIDTVLFVGRLVNS